MELQHKAVKNSVLANLDIEVERLRSLPSSRENSIAITHLETAILWLRGR